MYNVLSKMEIVYSEYEKISGSQLNCLIKFTLRMIGVPPWSSGSVLDHRSLPPCLNPSVGISEGCFVFHFVSLALEVTRPI